MKLIDTTPTLFAPDKAKELAAMMTETDEDGWEYRVKHDPKGMGYSLVEVYDEDGEFVTQM